MREVPKQIWAVHWNAEGAVTNGAWADTIRHFGGGVEYIRADHVDAMLKAERERARDEKDAYWKAYLTEKAALNRLAEKAVREKALREAAQIAQDKHDTAMKWAAVHVKNFDGETDSLRISREILALIEKDVMNG